MSEGHAEHEEEQEGLRDRGSSRGEGALGDLANALLDNPVFHQALSAAAGAGERAAQAQKAAMDAIGLPSADDLSRLERRLRSLSARLEEVEDQLDDLTREIGALRRSQKQDAGAG